MLWHAAWSTRLAFLTFSLEENLLLAKDQLFGHYRVSTSLPDNQWQLELQNAYNTSLALLQFWFNYHAYPPRIRVTPNSTYDQYVTQANTNEEVHICHNQKIRSSTYYSFSVVGLAIIILGGSAVILLSNLIPLTVQLWRKRKARQGNADAWRKQEEWALTDVLQLHRIALERYGLWPWKVDGEVPLLTGYSRQFKLPWLDGKEPRTESETDRESLWI